MRRINERKLLQNNDVVNEIERYRWVESEKCGCDIDFQIAADRWIVYHALAWLKYHSSSNKKLRLTSFIRHSIQPKKVQTSVSSLRQR